MSKDKQITVTSPLLPSLEDFNEMLKQIWDSKWITNNGEFHHRLEVELASYLKVPYLSLFTNGTLPLLAALKALNISGEVITTPYSFVATSHVLWWSGLKPVFVDVDPITCNIDPNRIQEAITPATSAILPVHCYGTPCDIDAIKDIADNHGLKVIYDAAHAFGVEKNDKSILRAGDISTLSFHATKIYNTIEGGAMIMHDEEMKRKVDFLKNFGFANETTVVTPGINCKLDEVRSAFGLLNLQQVDKAIDLCKATSYIYREALKNVEGVRMLPESIDVTYNYSYFPIFIDKDKFGKTRDQLYFEMKKDNVLARRYFYPLITDFAPYNTLPSAEKKNLINAHALADSVICLPMHQALSRADIDKVLSYFQVQ